jgi:ATP-dependent Lhr-like helicase
VTRDADVLDLFSPQTRSWFSERLGEPTEVQRLAWPRIAAGEHALVTAPTGSGKTLAAFLWALDLLLTGAWDGGRVRVLYVSPLRALGNDIRRNLLEPLAELQPRFETSDRAAPAVRVMSRTGDTPPHERRQMIKNPPEILITTPESLNILLTSRGGRQLFDGLETVILDEIHAVVGSKRGVHLMTAVERLVPLTGEVQRIALSATVRPLERIARWAGGHRLDHVGGAEARYVPRDVAVVAAESPKRYELEVALPVAEPGLSREPDTLWAELTSRLKSTVRANRSTLIFGNSKRTVEKVARFLNEDEHTQLAYSHHGALSRELRAVVEERLKAGTLKAIVATNSLELGIDIGSIDEVALVQPPPTVASALQRLGRSGHSVGETSRGRLYPLHPYGLLEAAVLARSVLDGDIEPAEPIVNPLDVLAQVVVSMTVGRSWPLDELYNAVRTADAYRTLPRQQFDLVLDMLAGRYASTRVRSLHPLVSIDRVDGTVQARPGAERLLYMSGGTIPDRGYFHLRVDGSGAPLGQLDEEFVWERSIGDTFTLGVQTWRVRRITHNDVFVAPADARSAMAPFWRAEERDRSSFLSDRVAGFLERALDRLDDETLVDDLRDTYHLEPTAAAELVRLLREQHAAIGTLPHRHQVVVEDTVPPSGKGHHRQLVLHTVWGGRVNRPFGYALAAAWHHATGSRPELVHGDDCIVLTTPTSVEVEDPFALVHGDNLEDLLRETVEGTGFFGARFREAAGRSLLLPRGGHRRRTPLWLNRQRAKELLEAVSEHGDFPLVLEAWRTCLQDEFELDELRQRLAEVRDGRITIRRVHTDTPSPFTEQVLWRQTNELMYADDRPGGRTGVAARPDLVRELALASHLRPLLPRHLADELQTKLQRTAPGYAPRDGADLLEWAKERLLIPTGEWRELLAAMERDHGVDGSDEQVSVGNRLVTLALLDPAEASHVCAVEMAPRVAAALEREIDDMNPRQLEAAHAAGESALEALGTVLDHGTGSADDLSLSAFLAEWLSFYGPVTPESIAATLGIDSAVLRPALDQLTEDQTIVIDQLLEGSESIEVCDRENLERLLRMHRAAERPVFRPLPVEGLPLFLARHQALGTRDATLNDLKSVLECLFGWPMDVATLETEILPARLDPYLPSWLDTLMTETDLQWFGCGERRLAMTLAGDRGLFAETPADGGGEEPFDIETLFPHPLGRFSFADLVRHTGGDSAELAEVLWRHAWRGDLTTDTFAPVRTASENDFRVEPIRDLEGGHRRRRRSRFDRWRSDRPVTGAWLRLPPVTPPTDALEKEEDDRDRARLLLDRYGIVFRELLERELPGLRWSRVFRALRMLELAGEVVAGRFFEGIPGLQFMPHSAVRELRDDQAEDVVWWMNATDPASPCGLGLEALKGSLPRRVPTSHLVYHGRRLVVISERRGNRLSIAVAADHPRLGDYFRFLKNLLGRPVKPLKAVTIETINDEPAASSPYREPLSEVFHVTRTHNGLRLSRRY